MYPPTDGKGLTISGNAKKFEVPVLNFGEVQPTDLNTVLLLFSDDVCLVAPEPQVLHDMCQHIRVLHHPG